MLHSHWDPEGQERRTAKITNMKIFLNLNRKVKLEVGFRNGLVFGATVWAEVCWKYLFYSELADLVLIETHMPSWGIPRKNKEHI